MVFDNSRFFAPMKGLPRERQCVALVLFGQRRRKNPAESVISGLHPPSTEWAFKCQHTTESEILERTRQAMNIQVNVQHCGAGLDRHRWGVILAGGEGKRLLPLSGTITGDDRPKQFCTILGDSTLLEQTRDRLKRVVRPEQTLTVVTKRTHRFTVISSTMWGGRGYWYSP